VKFGSVCSGIESATVAWEPLGWRPVFYSENDEPPSRLLASHFPQVPNFGDMNGFRKWPETEIDLLVGGTPCQSFSVAGLRAGLADPRGNLALVYIAIAERYRPRWLVWENVPGVLSSHGGRDFGSFIGALVKCGYGVAYRVFDAQYCGVPQRRRRVFVVGHFGAWHAAGSVLFERDSLLRHPPPSRSPRQGSPGAVAAGVGKAGELIAEDVAHCLQTTANDYSRADGFNMVLEPTAIHGTQDPDLSDVAHPLGRNSGQENALVYDETQITSAENRSNPQPGDPSHPLVASGKPPTLVTDYAPRRLTPTECERLQGFPDGYTALPGMSDGNRYRMLGNAMPVPVVRWIGQRIANYEEAQK